VTIRRVRTSCTSSGPVGALKMTIAQLFGVTS